MIAKKLASTLAVLAAFAVAPAAAAASSPIPPSSPTAQTAAGANGIIAILIGFTPPIGSNKGSIVSSGPAGERVSRLHA